MQRLDHQGADNDQGKPLPPRRTPTGAPELVACHEERHHGDGIGESQRQEGVRYEKKQPSAPRR